MLDYYDKKLKFKNIIEEYLENIFVIFILLIIMCTVTLFSFVKMCYINNNKISNYKLENINQNEMFMVEQVHIIIKE